MADSKYELKAALFEDGTYAVLRIDAASPRMAEVIGTFYDKLHAHHFIGLHGVQAKAPLKEKRPPAKSSSQRKAAKAVSHKAAEPAKKMPEPASASSSKPAPKAARKGTTAAQPKKAAAAVKPKEGSLELSDRQTAVLKALRSLMDKKHRVEAKAAELAKASSVPLGSLHSVLSSLEKKHMIRTERQGSPKFSAIYEVLSTAAKNARPLNGIAHARNAGTQLAR